jgi:hypothetical protein
MNGIQQEPRRCREAVDLEIIVRNKESVDISASGRPNGLGEAEFGGQPRA